MKRLKLRLILLVLLVCLAFASAAFALKPLIDGAEKSIEVKQAVEEYRETISEIREEAERAEIDEETVEPQEVIPYAQLYEDMQTYNQELYLCKQKELDCKSAYEQSQFSLTDYGLLDLNVLFHAVDHGLHRNGGAGEGKADQQHKQQELPLNAFHVCPSLSPAGWSAACASDFSWPCISRSPRRSRRRSSRRISARGGTRRPRWILPRG